MAEPTAQSNPGGLRPIRHIVRHPHTEEILPLRDGNAPASKPKPTCKSLEEYRKQAAAQINDPKQGANQDTRARNSRISGAYASLWMQDHDAFRWQGLAAHASTGVGFAMDLSNPKLQDEAAATLASGHLPSWVPPSISGPLSSAKRDVLGAAQWVGDSRLGREFAGDAQRLAGSQLGQDAASAARWVGNSALGRETSRLAGWAGGKASEAAHGLDDMTRQPLDADAQRILGEGNLAIYSRIMPPSLAYAHGGMAELDCVSGKLTGQEKRDFDKVRSSIADTNAGSALKKAGDAAGGERLVNEGVTKLVHIEQDDVAQPGIYDQNPKMSRLMGPAAFLQLSGTASLPKFDWSTFSAYYQNHFGASLGNMQQRDDWILNDVVPTWNNQVTGNTAVTAGRMQTILDRGRAAGGGY